MTQIKGPDLWTPFDYMAKSMLPFLEGGAAIAHTEEKT